MIVHATIPGGTARNGLPERTGYVYRGNNQDELTGNLGDYALEPYRVEYRQWIPEHVRDAARPRAGRCDGCGYKSGAANCRALCGAS